MRRVGVVLLAALLAASASCSQRPSERPASRAPSSHLAASQASAVTADAVPPDPRVGAIFLGGQSLHTCSGSVLHAATGDLVLTAAHCMVEGVDGSFVPAFANEAQPQDFWHVDQVYLDSRWVSTQDPLADFAILRVSRGSGASLESVVGTGFALGSTPEVGTDVDVTGYALGVGGDPIGCTGRIAAHDRGYPLLNCAGLVDGTSGAPWLARGAVVGVTGGLNGGGCQQNVSYAPPFDQGVRRLVARAEAGGPGDVAPSAYDDGC